MKGLVLLLTISLAVAARAGEIIVQKIAGDVSVRHGVTEVWVQVAPGDVLRPDDTMKTGKRGSAMIQAPVGGGTRKVIALPPEVIVDMSDIRDLSQEELMLKLTMEKVRASSYQWKNDELHIPNAAVVHGTAADQGSGLRPSDVAVGRCELNGARVLFNNGFYATCALKGMEVFRQYPALAGEFRNRLMVAEALEKARLRGEAISEYGALLSLDGLSRDQEKQVNARIQALRK